MNKGIWQVASARLCPFCAGEMQADYVMRERSQWEEGVCDNCGQKHKLTRRYQYTMSGAGLRRIGRENG